MSSFLCRLEPFETIRNNTALKHDSAQSQSTAGFGTIRNNTALKHRPSGGYGGGGFGTIRNNTALKLSGS